METHESEAFWDRHLEYMKIKLIEAKPEKPETGYLFI